MEETITMIIGGDGQVELETSGFKGKQCEKTTSKILVSLNGKVVEDQKKSEYYEDGDDPVKVLNL